MTAKINARTTTLVGIEAAQMIKNALAEAGMPRTSGMSGGEVTGWTQAYGATGFSLRAGKGRRDIGRLPEGQVDWHIVVSGKPLLAYREYEGEDGDTYHEPIRPESLCPRIRQVFEALGMTVHKVTYSGHQTVWDDDITYNVITDEPAWLSRRNHR